LRVELRATDDQVRGVISNFQQFLQSSPQN
jgi:hypothetical protein